MDSAKVLSFGHDELLKSWIADRRIGKIRKSGSLFLDFQALREVGDQEFNFLTIK